MVNILVCGINGAVGKRVYLASKNNDAINVVCGIDVNFDSYIGFDCPVYSSFDQVKEIVDVIIDFSVPSAINDVLDFAVENGCALVEGVTGFSAKEKEKISEASEKIPVFMPTNVSLGVNVLLKLCLKAAESLVGNFDVEIVEEHNACKANSPSMTSKMIAEAIGEALGKKRIISGRKGNEERKHDEICIHSIRGGNVNGKTTVMFIGEDETVSITQEVHNKTLFAQGACDIAQFINGKKPGLYNLEQYFKN